MAFLVANSYLGLAKEATRGTTQTTAPGTAAQLQWIPVTSPQVTPTQVFLRDEALRGSPVMVYDQVQGVRHDEVDFKTYGYADSFPLLVASILGGTDTVTGATSYTHTIPLLNSASTGSQPPSYSVLDFDGANWFLMNGAQAASLAMTFGAEAALDGTVKFIANPYTSSTSYPTFAGASSPSITSEAMIPAWDTTITISGTSIGYIQSGELTLDRKTAPIFTMGQQGPRVNFAGPLEVSGKFTAVVDTNADPFSTTSTYSAGNATGTAYGLFRSASSIPLVIKFTDPNDSSGGVNHSMQFTMSDVQFHDVRRVRGKDYTEVEVNFTAQGNSTDATTGYSPVKFVGINGTSVAYN